VPAYIETRSRIIAVVAIFASLATLALRFAGADGVVVFGVSAVGLAGLAALVGEGTEQLGHRLGPSATGVLQSALGNLPELFIGIFALRAGLVEVVRSALVGSILANTLLVLGLAFIAGGLRHGPQKFGTDQTKMMSTLLVLAVAAMVIPTIAEEPGGPASGHATELSIVVSLVLLAVFAASLPFSINRGMVIGAADSGEATATQPGRPDSGRPDTGRPDSGARSPLWPLPLALGTLLAAGLGAAFVSDWFIEALKPAMSSLGMSQSFAGLVVVAIAGNAVENVVGIRAMLADRGDLAISLILNSSLQVALALTPALVILSLLLGGAALTLTLSPLLIAALALATLLAALVVIDGESTWLEGLALVGLYVIIAASVWWGAPIA
jgi:Ca2+:H+ antiporter